MKKPTKKQKADAREKLNFIPEVIPQFYQMGENLEKALFYKENDEYFINIFEKELIIKSNEAEYKEAGSNFVKLNKLIYKMNTQRTNATFKNGNMFIK